MNKLRENRLFILVFGLILFYIFISSSLHFHSDGQSHKDCLLCQYSNFLHSMQTENVFAITCNYTFIFHINPHLREISFSGQIQDFYIRPPPLAA